MSPSTLGVLRRRGINCSFHALSVDLDGIRSGRTAPAEPGVDWNRVDAGLSRCRDAVETDTAVLLQLSRDILRTMCSLNDLCLLVLQAAKESRRRKKMRIEELGRSVVFLTRENQELREQNEIFRQMVVSHEFFFILYIFIFISSAP